MKLLRIKLIVVIGSLLVISTSCSDWLNLLPEDELVSDEFWMSQADVESVLSNTYGVISNDVKRILLWGELRGGLLSEGTQVPSDYSKILKGDLTSANSLTSWTNMYKAINGANQIIKFAPDVVNRDPSFSLLELNQILSEALFIRSLAYFYLVRTYKEVPLILEPYITDEQDYYPEKSDEETIIAQIIGDLITAKSNAVISFDSKEYDKGRATKYAVHALLADVYLRNDKFSEAITECDEIINSNHFGLLGESNWFENFYPGNSNSSIFEIQFAKRWGTSPGLYETFSYQKSKQFIMNARVLELYDEDDIRGIGTTYGKTNLEIWKYVGINPDEERGDILNDNNFIIYRMAEIMLFKAEALIELEQFDDALLIINELRGMRGIGDLSAEPSVEAFEDILLDEIAREHAGEGKYWFDILRIGRRDNYRRQELVISSLILNATADVVFALQIKFQDPYSWYLPISQTELETNLNLVQNSYYQK